MSLSGRRVLVLGGTRYVGRRLVGGLVERGAEVTIATRGQTPDPFGDSVARTLIDRFDPGSLAPLAAGQAWDLIYDQICYAPSDALDACRIFAERAGRYVFVSSQAVYDERSGLRRVEADFDPWAREVVPGRRDDFTYSEGKRLAEAALFQQASFPVVAVRFPMIFAADDYSRRLHDAVESVRQGRPLLMRNRALRLSLISADEAAALLLWLADIDLVGPLNACSDGTTTHKQITELIEQATGVPAKITADPSDDPFAMFYRTESLTMDTTKARSAGFAFDALDAWLPRLIKELAVSGL
jgi:nucleoside-diphosphate-sugar epimerase